MNYKGTAGDDTLTGTSGNDVFNMTQGGNDTVHAGDGNDVIAFGVTYDANDFVDGGTGTDTLKLDGNYGTTLFIAPTMMQNVERIDLAAGHSYDLAFFDGVIGSGQTLTIDGSGLLSTDYFSIDPSYMTALSVNTTIIADSGAGTNYFTAGPGANILHGGTGYDLVSFTGQFNATDRIDGGGGESINSITLDGDYSAGLAITSAMMTNIQNFYVDGGYSYKLTTSDANVAAGQVLHVIETSMGAGDSLTFNGSHETDGAFYLSDGSGNDVLSGGAQSDTFAAFAGGNDKLYGNGGDDQILLGVTLTAADHIDGGAGSDELDLSGDYSAGLTLGAATLVNVETLFLYSGNSYKLTTNDANIAAGKTLTVDAQELGAGDSLTINGSHETDGHFYFYGGAGNDVLIGGQAGNTFFGNLGADKMTAGLGADKFVYATVSDSTGVTRDIITGYNALHDTFDLPSGHSVAAIDTAVTTGALSTGNFDTNLAAAIDAAHLAAGDAVLFTPDAGTLAGHTFLVIDMNGTAGYQAGQDLVIQLESATHLANLATTDFI